MSPSELVARVSVAAGRAEERKRPSRQRARQDTGLSASATRHNVLAACSPPFQDVGSVLFTLHTLLRDQRTIL
jgi:hypothetical protein